jgi:outer membrane murein-binding lipoprotein Lpp
MRTTKLISLITSVLVLALAVAAFVLSYDALQALAVANGVETHLAWIWPFVIDGFLIVASLSVLRNGLLGEKALYPWALVVLFTGASIAFNIAHAPEALLARVVGAIPPLALALAFELLMGQLKSEVKRGQAVKSLEQLKANVSELTAEREQLTDHVNELVTKREQLTGNVSELAERVNELTGKRERLVNEIEQRCEEQPAPGCEQDSHSREFGQIQQELDQANLTRREQAQLATEQLLTFYRENPDAAQSEAGEFVDRSRSWVSKTLGELEEAGAVRRNGNGVQVLT